MAATTQRPKLLVIVGETASGKSALAMKVAMKFDGEIIAADSWTVYKGFDIGTSKPSKNDQKQIRHHLLDVVDSSEGFNAPRYKVLAETAIKDIKKRGRLPIMVGGTGLYIDSVLFDFGFLPNVGPDERQKLNALQVPELLALAKARRIDLDGIDTRNKRRIIRAIEAKGQKPTKKALKKGVLIVGLQVPREELRNRVGERTQRMIKVGLEQEVKRLADQNGWEVEPMKGIGYREWREYFEDKQTLEQTKSRIISATMNLAKRQRTWFRRNRHINWFNSPQEAWKFIENRFLNT